MAISKKAFPNNTLSKLALAIVLANSAISHATPVLSGTQTDSANFDVEDIALTNTTNITQSADVVTINWDSFDVGSGETVNFIQETSDVAINNIGVGVDGATASSILGDITANGTVFLSNANGFIFGADSSINTGAFLATTSSLSYDGDINLTDESVDGSSISIHNNASINANEQAEGGYLAFISNEINTTGTSSSDTSGLNATNGDILLSNDVESTIKLAGLNINFPASTFEGASTTNIDLTNADITSERVILTSNNLTRLLDSVIPLPQSISTSDLIVSSDTLGDTSEALSTAINGVIGNGESDNLSIDTLTINNTGSSAISLERNINLEDNSHLVINSAEINLNNGNILGSSSDLTLNATNLSIGDLPQDFGGINGLNTITINANETTLEGNVHATGDITINGDLQIIRDSGANENGIVQTKLRSDSGTITLENGSVSFDSNEGYLGDLYVLANELSLENITNFSSVKLNANEITLNGDIQSSDTISINNTTEDYVDIKLSNDIALSANTIEFEDFNLTSIGATQDLTLNVTGDGFVKLINANVHEDSSLLSLNNLVITNSNTDTSIDTTSNILMSGDFNTNGLVISSDTASNNFSFELDDDTSLNTVNTLDISNTTLSGDYLFTVSGDSSLTSSAELGEISNLSGVHISNFENTILNNHISTKENGLTINSNNILINDSLATISTEGGSTNTVLISNTNGGDIELIGEISSSDVDNKSSLSIETRNSDIHIGNVNNLKGFSIEKELQNEGSLILEGNISTSDSILLTNLGQITSDNSIDLATSEADGVISIIDSYLSTEGNDVSIESSVANLGDITANNISVNVDDLNLSGDLLSTINLTLLNGSDSKIVNISLQNDLTMSGDIDFLSTSNTQVNFSGNSNLAINSLNENIYLTTFNTTDQLNSLSITAGTEETANNIYLDTDSDGQFILPNVYGTEGISLLGNINLIAGENKKFDTSDYNGNLDFSGLNIIGSENITFDTGTGELSLGNLVRSSDDTPFKNLYILSTGKLNLYGELDIATEKFDFTNLNSIDLYADLTLGSLEVPTSIDFGSASINGTHDLTLYSTELVLGSIGNNIALQDLTIVNTSESPLTLSNDIHVVGTVDIQATTLELNSSISSTGLDINISTANNLIMSADSIISADYGDINLTSTLGNIGVGQLIAGQDVTIRSESGYLYNNIGDYISNSSTSTNITSENQFLYGLTNIGESVASPIVINTQNGGTITAESSGTIFIANLANANVVATGRVIDGSSGGETASIDAFTQFKLSSLNTINLPAPSSNLGLISNLTWQVDEDESIRKIKSPASAPSIYYSRKGWRLGQK